MVNESAKFPLTSITDLSKRKLVLDRLESLEASFGMKRSRSSLFYRFYLQRIFTLAVVSCDGSILKGNCILPARQVLLSPREASGDTLIYEQVHNFSARRIFQCFSCLSMFTFSLSTNTLAPYCLAKYCTST